MNLILKITTHIECVNMYGVKMVIKDKTILNYSDEGMTIYQSRGQSECAPM